MNIALIVAAGKGQRMKAKQNKVFLKLDKHPVIYYTIKAFQKHRDIDQVVILTGKPDMAKMQKIVDQYKFKKVEAIIAGGRERQDTVYEGLKYLQLAGASEHDLVLVHNGGNPLVSGPEISDSIKMGRKYGAAVCARPVRDTIKRVSPGGLVVETLDRSELWAMQTPQTIKFGLAVKAFSKAYQDGFYGTDDVSLVGRLGKRVKIVPCSEDNIKITYPGDLLVAKSLLKRKD